MGEEMAGKGDMAGAWEPAAEGTGAEGTAETPAPDMEAAWLSAPHPAQDEWFETPPLLTEPPPPPPPRDERAEASRKRRTRIVLTAVCGFGAFILLLAVVRMALRSAPTEPTASAATRAATGMPVTAPSAPAIASPPPVASPPVAAAEPNDAQPTQSSALPPSPAARAVNSRGLTATPQGKAATHVKRVYRPSTI
jgi:hypothetical protein